MAIIQLLLALIVLGMYVRMIRREVPERISKGQASVPVILGVLSS